MDMCYKSVSLTPQKRVGNAACCCKDEFPEFMPDSVIFVVANWTEEV